jgi:hypothetical protein
MISAHGRNWVVGHYPEKSGAEQNRGNGLSGPHRWDVQRLAGDVRHGSEAGDQPTACAVASVRLGLDNLLGQQQV